MQGECGTEERATLQNYQMLYITNYHLDSSLIRNAQKIVLILYTKLSKSKENTDTDND